MGLYQTKGREADATVVVLRNGDFYGAERHPFPVGSRLLYVVLTRARHKTILLLFGSGLPALVAPLASLAPPALPFCRGFHERGRPQRPSGPGRPRRVLAQLACPHPDRSGDRACRRANGHGRLALRRGK